jgi:hypothetical protein
MPEKTGGWLKGADAKPGRGFIVSITLIPALFILLLLFFSPSLSTVTYKGRKLLVLHPATLLQLDRQAFDALTLKTYTLQTEYGELTIKPFCKIRSSRTGTLSIIDRKNFQNDKATHNLIFNDKPVSKNIYIAFFDDGTVNYFLTRDLQDDAYIHRLAQKLQDDDYFHGAVLFNGNGGIRAYNTEGELDTLLKSMEAYPDLLRELNAIVGEGK